MTKRIAIYPGTFDPITKGHLDVIERGLKLFDTLIVAVAADTSKTTLFTVEERVAMICEVTTKHKNVKVEGFKGLLINYVKKKSPLS